MNQQMSVNIPLPIGLKIFKHTQTLSSISNKTVNVTRRHHVLCNILHGRQKAFFSLEIPLKNEV